ncbi:MAG: hypothetical protein JST20_02315 [Bacteroidetes bacterium]|nr:hypothetical protein [Bacteroidota bacterium]
MKILFSFIFVFLSFSINVSAQDNPPKANAPSENLPSTSALPKEIVSMSTEFFKLMMVGNTGEAFKKLLQNSPIGDKPEQIKHLTDQAKRAEDIYGIMKGFERVGSESVAESYFRLRYLALHDKYPMRWIFTFYKSPIKGWIAVNVKFDDDSEYFFSKE